MSVKDKYIIKSIDKHLCKEWFLKKHYAKRMPLISYVFGLFNKDRLVGVCSFGLASPKMNKGKSIFKNYEVKVLELNRLVVNDNLDKNSLSYFVSNCLKKIPINPLCVVSFADCNVGHTGYIYQATNWIYTGKTTKGGKMKYYFLNNKEYHSLTITEKWFSVRGLKYDTSKTLTENWEIIGGYVKEFDTKHRYLYFIGNKKDIKQMYNTLKLKKINYPKNENKRYNANYCPLIQTELF
jgi:hypothetical protein|tara:strand:- start:304 stop:1017 length:714 start_codon:yes stop_codon:yes gene_type:complete